MITPEEQSWALDQAHREKLINKDDTAVLFYNASKLHEKLQSVKDFFVQTGALHTVAIKTNPTLGILKEIVQAGFGLEAASLAEVKMALKAGCEKHKIVFDSPAKTQSEINWCVNHLKGATVNANCLEELHRYPNRTGLHLGLRLNVQRSSGSADFLDVAGACSKFGEPISRFEEILKAAKTFPELNTLHIHQGSQNNNVDVLLRGIKEVVNTAESLNKKLGKRQITTIDIGGGFAVNYSGDDEWDIARLYTETEQFFQSVDGRFGVITELGRYYHAHAGFVAAQCEYVLNRASARVLITHAGADLFLRECYVPDARPQTFHLFGSDYKYKGTNKFTGAPGLVESHVAGPLCFGGDFPAKGIQLPPAQAGDILVFNDAGANTLALWSIHCSRAAPSVILYNVESKSVKLIKKRQTHEEVMRFWQ